MGTTAGEVLDRLQQAMGLASDGELARALGVKRSTVGSWRNRNSVPYDICVDLAQERNWSLDWLLIGRGQLLEARSDDAAKERIQAWIDEFWARAGPKERNWLEVQFELNFPQYLERKSST